MNAMDLRNVKLNDLLGAVGLQTRRAPTDMVLPAVGLFAAGLVFGCGIGMMLAPKSGAQLRQDLVGRVKGREQLREYEQRTA